MPRFREMPVSSTPASSLLSEYFDERAATFPVAQGSYHTATPVDATFTPPAGVFVVAVADGAADASVRDAGGVGDVTPDGDDALACGGVRRLEPGADGRVRYEVKHLFVRPVARGRGLGRLVLAELERRAIDLGAEQLVLDTNDSLEAAGGLYRAAGYSLIEPYNDNPNATAWYGKTAR
ncbi:GNAT family N-acetyltransferase [Frigoribacterium sp. CFBP9030]|uniref:GNAT family N-acetyltransferase n=1 Tax=Frigoribacterium sp. CFBP9030 TaxID=3096537 RepID=UPI002A6A8AC7|nr:GNAT family N-acetyltransferase [Frigoribacterium sp. CFBP9030]MDY0890724.1 GNAT family N-acetyltransferase [Frigoribacterium sp. CFBP9030]